MRTTKIIMKMTGAAVLTAALTIGTGFMTFAAGWTGDASTGYRYARNDAGDEFYKNGWQWLDGNNDGVAECYYFDVNGYMLSNTTTPDGYTVNADGAWVWYDEIITLDVSGRASAIKADSTIDHGEDYDPAHPLANKIEEYGLSLVPTGYLISDIIVSKNLQARLTNQMEYYDPGMYLGENSHVGRRCEEELYQWFCNWLNGLDLDNMSEMDKAMEIKKYMAQAEYEYVNDPNSAGGEYGILINKKGVCAEYAGTACSLAKAMGLKHALSGFGDHMDYYVQVDGVSYYGSNGYLNLELPRPEWTVFF